MAKIKDLTGWRIGKLRVLESIGFVRYGGRSQPLWLCACDCGARIKLVTDKLPTTPKGRETMMRSGRRLYDCCESCRQKACVICGESFSFSHPSHICPSEACQEALRLERDAFWKAVYRYRYQTDAEFRVSERQKMRIWWGVNQEAIRDRRTARVEALTDDELAALNARKQAERRRWYQRMKADPDRYANWLAWHRQWRTEQQLKTMLADAAALQRLIETEEG